MNLHTLIFIITLNNNIIPKSLGIILLFLLLKPLFNFMVKNLRPNGYQPFYIFKIYNLGLTTIFCLLYFFLFIIGIFYLRLQRSNYFLDLKPIFSFFKVLYLMGDYLLIILTILFCFCVIFGSIGLFVRIKDFLELELLKMHLYLFPLYHFDSTNQSIYYKFIADFPGPFTITIYLLRPLELFCLLFPNNKYLKIIYETFRHIISNLIHHLLKIHYGILLLFVIMIYDLYYNDFVIIVLFKFLPFYFIYMLWVNFFNFLYTKGALDLNTLSVIVYDLYYNKQTVKYFNISDEEKKMLHIYVQSGLTGTDEIFGTDISSYGFRLLFYCRYVLLEPNTLIYVNKQINKMINMNQFKTLKEQKLLQELII